MEDYYSHRLRRLERAQAKQAAYTADSEHYQFRMACSCPPDKRLHMRGGLMYSQESHDGWFVQDATLDLTDSSQTGGVTFERPTAYYYQAYLVRLENGGLGGPPYVFGLPNSGNIFATAAEAEQDLMDYVLLGHEWRFDYPLCGLITRNDGRINTDYAIMPVDPINRGRSYIWPRDYRPRNIAL